MLAANIKPQLSYILESATHIQESEKIFDKTRQIRNHGYCKGNNEFPLIEFQRKSCGIVRYLIDKNQSGFVEYKAANFPARFIEEDTCWTARPGDIVRVIGCKGAMLVVEPRSPRC